MDREEFIDFLCEHEVRSVPTENDVKRVIVEVAHKELVQQPMFVTTIFREVLKHASTIPRHFFQW